MHAESAASRRHQKTISANLGQLFLRDISRQRASAAPWLFASAAARERLGGFQCSKILQKKASAILEAMAIRGSTLKVSPKEASGYCQIAKRPSCQAQVPSHASSITSGSWHGLGAVEVQGLGLQGHVSRS